MTDKVYRVSFLDDENVSKFILLMVVQVCEYTTILLNFILHKGALYLKKIIHNDHH